MFDVGLGTTILALFSGAIVGFVLGLVGGGGSILALPLLVYLVGYKGEPHVAIGTTALAVATSAFASILHHRRDGNVRLREGLWFALPGVAGALLGAQLGLRTDADRLLFLFALLMLVVAWRLWREPENAKQLSLGARRPFRRRYVSLAGVGVGALSGFFGIGGGFLIVPALFWTAKLDMREATGTSLIAVAAFGLATAARYGLAGQLDLPLAALFMLGGLAGGFLGWSAGSSIDKRALRKWFALALLPMAAYMLYRNVVALTA